ncbi:hypothetical protein GCM10027292_22910 [Hydrogenophaga aquatica]
MTGAVTLVAVKQHLHHHEKAVVLALAQEVLHTLFHRLQARQEIGLRDVWPLQKAIEPPVKGWPGFCGVIIQPRRRHRTSIGERSTGISGVAGCHWMSHGVMYRFASHFIG